MLEMLKARKEALQERGVKGFTLMEMLIVIAIIAVLIAIAIPVLSGQLENAKEATDAANLRSAYATASVTALEQNKDTSAGPVAMTQGTEGFSADNLVNEKIGGAVELSTLSGAKDGVSYYVNVPLSGTPTITTAAAYTNVVDPVTGQAPSASTD